MTARIDTTIEFRRTQSVGPAIVYILPHRGEEFLKLGFSRDPLQRMQDLHRRYFDFFDMDRVIFIETSRVVEARRIETNLKRSIVEHRAPSPLDIRHEAGGHTEWYRGAYTVLHDRARELERDGATVHWTLRNWIAPRLLSRRELLFEWACLQLQSLEIAGVTSAHGSRIASALRDTLDAYTYFGIDITDAVSVEVAQWYAQSNK